MSNITPQGWESQSVGSIVEEIVTSVEDTYGKTFPTTPDSFSGQLFNILAAQEKKIQDLGQAITSTQNLSTAEGIYLDYIAEHKGTRRLRASGSYGSLLINGRQNTLITAGTPFKDVLGRTVLTSEDMTINRAACYQAVFTINEVIDSTEYVITVEGVSYTYTSGVATTEEDILAGLLLNITGSADFTSLIAGGELIINNVNRSNTLTVASGTNIQIVSVAGLVDAIAVEEGVTSFPANSITTVVINSLSINFVTNPFDFISGRFEETDPELRARLSATGVSAGVATIPAMQASITQVTGVTNVLIVDNKTDTVDGSGIPPRSFETFVVGGTDQEVGEKIFEVQPAGISTHGDITVQFNDLNGDPQTASFSRKSTKIAWVEVDYSLNTEEDFPSDGESLISALIVSQGNSMYAGEDLVANKFMGACYSVEGIYVNSIRVAVTDSLSDIPSYQTGKISINANQALSFSASSVTFINT
ncbi:baseplate wedge subunit [Vibrio phage K354]